MLTDDKLRAWMEKHFLASFRNKNEREMWRQLADIVNERDALRAELAALRANVETVAGVGLPETGEGE